MQLVLAPWDWFTDPSGESYWRKPGGDYSGGCVDLRSNVEAGAPGPTAAGFGLFAYETLPAGIQVAVDLGDDPNRRMRLVERNGLADTLGLARAAFPDAPLAQVLMEHVMGAASDPTGQNRVKPIRLNGGGATIRLKGFGEIHRIGLDRSHPNFARTLQVRRADYARQRTAWLPRWAARRSAWLQVTQGMTKTDADALAALQAQRILRKWTGWDLRLLGATLDELLPAQYLADGEEEPSTTLTESWPTNSSTISSGQDNPWTEERDDASVASGKLGPVNVDENAIVSCDTSLSSDDHYHTASYALTAAATTLDSQVAVRYDAAVLSNNFSNAYLATPNRTTGSESGRIRKRVAGAVTTLDTETGDPGATGTVTCQADASAITGTVGSLPSLSATDSSITGYLQVGCLVRIATGLAHADSTLDSHTFADVAAAATTHPGWFSSRGGWF